jgi:hypothetical protein
MPLHHTGLRYPHERVLLPRTKLAYVHLPNLLSDAKRDRSARVFGYVGVWLPDELVLLYMHSGEVVNATRSNGTGGFVALSVAAALERIPHDPEFGEVCFHEADDEQLACMYATQLAPSEPWPAELNPNDPSALFPYLMATTFDGVVEIVADGHISYLIFRDGAVTRAFLSGPAKGSLVERVQSLFGETHSTRSVQRWPIPAPLPQQAPHALVQAYRDLIESLIERLMGIGRESALAIAEHARRTLAEKHPVLERFPLAEDLPRQDPVEETEVVSRALAAWVSEIVWTAADHDEVTPAELLRDLTRDRRHMLQSAGFYEHLPFRIEW